MIEQYINKIICGDCLEVMKNFPDNSVDLIVTDPPYFLPATHYNTRRKFGRTFSDLGILEHFIKDLFCEINRIISNTGYLYVFCDGQSYPIFYYHAYFRFHSVRPLIWDKMISINGYAWRHQHEIILFAKTEKAKLIKTGDGDILKHRAVPINDREHPAEKPINLLRHIIFKHRDANLTLDPFCGSGSTLIAAKETGHNYIGIDNEIKYINIAIKRLKENRQSSIIEN